MDKNIKVAKELIKLAKNLIALDEEGDGSGFQPYHDYENAEQERFERAQKEGKKYILHHKDHGLWRIQACKNFGDIEKGEFGGLIESEKNLSHDDDCWVYDDAQVYGNAKVYDDAYVGGNAKVYDDAQVFGKAQVFGNARVYKGAKVYEGARVYNDAQVYQWAQVFGDAKVYDQAQVCKGAKVYENAQVYGEAWVSNHAQIHGKAKVDYNVNNRNITR